jgi:hypothetical protein
MTILNESLHEISNDNGVKVVNFVTQRKCNCPNIHKYIWTLPDKKMHNQIHQVLIDKRQLISVNYDF